MGMEPEERRLASGFVGLCAGGGEVKRKGGEAKREERDKHDQDERVEGRNGSFPEWRDGTEKVRPLAGKREGSRGKREERRENESSG